MKRHWRVSTDVGGTFTDLVYFGVDDKGQSFLHSAKTDTTPPAFENGILDALQRARVDPRGLSVFAHGTTVVINALTERRGVRVGLITTRGFRDVLEIARGTRPDFFNMRYRKPPPFVPRYLRQEVTERIDADGREVVALAIGDLGLIVEQFRREGVQAVAVCLLHAYLNPVHELAVLRELRRLWPEVTVVASHEITREWREYERTCTTVLSAYVQPIAEQYLDRLRGRLADRGYSGPIHVMQSNGGVDTLARARRIPITMVESGPASGMWGAAALGRLIDEPKIIALDIGGTTAKCALIDGQVPVKTTYHIEQSRESAGYPIMVPVVDLVEVGNGGGSIAWVNEFGKLHVGPRSAGARPGPAAYGKGGSEVTTTDANLALGRINPKLFCGGDIVADIAATEAALGRLADRLRCSKRDAARGVIEIADANMTNALKLVSVNRGFDPREFTLVAFGGGGGLHAVSLARELRVSKVIVPRYGSVFSAWGMLMSDLRRDRFVTRVCPLSDTTATRELAALLRTMSDDIVGEFAADGVSGEGVVIEHRLRLRYQNQEHACEIALTHITELTAAMEDIVKRFNSDYERQYTYQLDAPVEIVGIHIIATAAIEKPEFRPEPLGTTDAATALKGRRTVDFGATSGFQEANLFAQERLAPGMRLDGPAVIEESGGTILVFPGNRVSIDPFRNVVIENI